MAPSGDLRLMSTMIEMTDNTSVKVKRADFKHAFAVLTDVSGYNERDFIRVEFENKREFYTKVIRINDKSEGESGSILALGSAWMSLMGLEDESGAAVISKWGKSGVKPAKNVWIRPESESDWEILEFNAEKIRNSALNQISLVKKGQKLVIFRDRLRIRCQVIKTDPDDSVVELIDSTLVLVEPKERKDPIPDLPPDSDSVNLLGRRIRVCKSPYELSGNHKFCGFIKFNDSIFANSDSFFIRFAVVPSPERENPDQTVRMIKCHSIPDHFNAPDDNILMPGELMKSLKLKIGAKIEISEFLRDVGTGSEQKGAKVKIYDASGLNRDIVNDIIIGHGCEDPNPVVIPNDSLLVFVQHQFSILTEKEPVILSKNEDYSNCEFEVKPVNGIPPTEVINKEEETLSGILLNGIEDVIEKLLLTTDGITTHSVLRGENGSGKSTCLRQIKRKCEEEHFIFCGIVECKRLIGKKAELIRKETESCLKRCEEKFPAAVLFDDLDALFSAQNAENEQNYAEGNYLNS